MNGHLWNASTREADGEKAVILINFSTETVSYDPACLEGAELMLSSAGESRPGTLQPLEAAIYLAR